MPKNFFISFHPFKKIKIKKAFVIFILITFFFTATGIGFLFPLRAKAGVPVVDWTAALDRLWEKIEEILVAVHDTVIFPMIATSLLTLITHSSDLPLLVKDPGVFLKKLASGAIAAAINEVLKNVGIDICRGISPILFNVVLVKFSAVEWEPECTLEIAYDKFKNFEETGFFQFSVALKEGGDLGNYFTLREQMDEKKAQALTEYYVDKISGQGYLPVKICLRKDDPTSCTSIVSGATVSSLIDKLLLSPLEAAATEKRFIPKYTHLLKGIAGLVIYVFSQRSLYEILSKASNKLR